MPVDGACPHLHPGVRREVDRSVHRQLPGRPRPRPPRPASPAARRGRRRRAPRRRTGRGPGRPARRRTGEHGVDQDVGRAAVDLPEAVGAHLEGTVTNPLGDHLVRTALALDAHPGPGGLDPAVGDRDDPVGPVRAQAEPAVLGAVVAHPGAPAQAVVVARHRLDLDRDVETRQASQLLGDHGRLQPTLRRERHVLEVAATAQPRPGEGARRLHPVRRRPVHGDRVTAQEPVADRPLGDLHGHLLARQGVPHEDDRPGRVGGLAGEPGDEVSAVGDGPDVDEVGLPHQRAAFRSSSSRCAPAGAAAQSISSRIPSDQLTAPARLLPIWASYLSARPAPWAEECSW